MNANEIPTVTAQMMIRKPVDEVFNAFIHPDITINFWFTRSTGKLEVGKKVTWFWEMYDAQGDVYVKSIDTNKQISTEWDDPPSTVDYLFKELTGNSTLVIIRNYGFQQTGNELIEKIIDSTGGFTTVLDGLKAYLEHGLKLNLVADKFPAKTI